MAAALLVVIYVDEIWFFEHFIECPVPRSFAWRFWTDVNNWKLDADVESVELNGPFAAGSHGATITRSNGRVEWRIAEVQPETGAVFEITLPGAILRFRWTFEDLGGAARMTQRAGIGGEAALPSLVPLPAVWKKAYPRACENFALPWPMPPRRTSPLPARITLLCSYPIPA